MALSLSIVVPCFNEAEVLPETLRRLGALMRRLHEAGRINDSSRLFIVDDGSRDHTWVLIEAAVDRGEPVVGVKLSRNRGHQNALLAGLQCSDGDAIVSIDADLQDDVEAIERMLVEFERGAEVVYGVRLSRETDTRFKRSSANYFYRLMRFMGAETIDNHADFRLMSRRAIDSLLQYREVNLYLRGIIPLLGFKTAVVTYERAARFAGESKYPLSKMLALSFDAITSFSVFPLRAISVMGLMVSVATVALGLWVLFRASFGLQVIPGWASTVLPIYFLGGIQLIGVGVIGEYVGKIYLETKSRPRFFVERVCRKTPSAAVQETKSQ